MALTSSSLATGLETLFTQKPGSSAEAAQTWANAYVSYATGALSTAGSLPVNASANLGILVPAFTSALESRSAAGAAGIMTQAVIAFWQAIVWTGPTAAGATIVPGNLALSGALGGVFSDLSEKSESDKADELADAFDVGAKAVVVMDVPYAQPAPPIVGPIN